MYAVLPRYPNEPGITSDDMKTAIRYAKDVKKFILEIIDGLQQNTMVDSRCGLHCTGCEWKVSHGYGGCIATNGNPFHGICPVAACCQDRGFTHCGEWAKLYPR